MPKLRTGFHWGTFPAGRGHCAAAWTAQGLSALVLPEATKTRAVRKLRGCLPPMPDEGWPSGSRVEHALSTAVRKAFSGKPFQWKDFDLFFLTPFQQKILEATTRIPWGQYRTYGWVAQKAGYPRGFRAAGQALNRNPISLLIPCHRVIASNNRLGGYGGGLDRKIELLRLEGVQVRGGRVSA